MQFTTFQEKNFPFSIFMKRTFPSPLRKHNLCQRKCQDSRGPSRRLSLEKFEKFPAGKNFSLVRERRDTYLRATFPGTAAGNRVRRCQGIELLSFLHLLRRLTKWHCHRYRVHLKLEQHRTAYLRFVSRELVAYTTFIFLSLSIGGHSGHHTLCPAVSSLQGVR